MKQATYNQLTGLLFAVVALVHALRVLLGWNAMIGGWEVPTWLSIVAIIAAGYLAYTAFKLNK